MGLNSSATKTKRNRLRQHWFDSIDHESFPHEIERRCKDCGQRKMCRWTHMFTQTGKPEYRIRCPECWNIRANALREARRVEYSGRALDCKSDRKSLCIEYLGGRCIKCGYDRCVKALTFHHRDSHQKSFTLSQRLDAAWDILRVELDKCDLLCFNCHMEEHCELNLMSGITPRLAGCVYHRMKVVT